MEAEEKEFTESFAEASKEIETGVATEKADADEVESDDDGELEGQGNPDEDPLGGEDKPDDEPEPDDEEKDGEKAKEKERPKSPDFEQKYKSMMGRFQKLQREHAELLKGQPPENGKDGESGIKKKTDIPEEQYGVIGEFKQRYPKLADYIEIEGEDGDRLRDILEEHGPDVAAIKAESMMSADEGRRKEENAKRRSEHSAKVAESNANIERIRLIADAHPEEAVVIFGEDREAAGELVTSIRAWAEALPYKDAVENLRIIDSGTPNEVNQLLTDYKKANKPGRKPPDKSVTDALAVPIKKTVAPKTRVAKDDFEGGFAEEAERLAKER